MFQRFRSSHILTCYNLFFDRYAFTPIVDFGDEEDEDENMTLSDAFGESRSRKSFICNENYAELVQLGILLDIKYHRLSHNFQTAYCESSSGDEVN